MMKLESRENVLEFAKGFVVLVCKALTDICRDLNVAKEASGEEDYFVTDPEFILKSTISLLNAACIEALGFQNNKVVLYVRNYEILTRNSHSLWERLQRAVDETYGLTLLLAFYNPEEQNEDDFQTYDDVWYYFGPEAEKMLNRFYQERGDSKKWTIFM